MGGGLMADPGAGKQVFKNAASDMMENSGNRHIH